MRFIHSFAPKYYKSPLFLLVDLSLTSSTALTGLGLNCQLTLLCGFGEARWRGGMSRAKSCVSDIAIDQAAIKLENAMVLLGVV